MTVHDQINRLQAAVAAYSRAFGRKPVLLCDADGVIYEWEQSFVAHYHRRNPELPRITEPFENFDMTAGRSPEEGAALLRTLDELDYTTIPTYAAATAVLPVLLEVGFDIAILTAPTTTNPYCASAKVFAIHRDFSGVFDERLIIARDKTRTVGDWLLDDKPSVTGLTDVPPTWKHVYFTQRYNEGLPGPRLVWETAFTVLADLVEDKVATHPGTAGAFIAGANA